MRQKLVEFYHRNQRSLGEPMLVPELHHNAAITQQYLRYVCVCVCVYMCVCGTDQLYAIVYM